MKLKSTHDQKKMIIIVFGIHILINLFLLLAYGTNHPIAPFIKWAPIWMKVILVSVFAFVIYASIAYFVTLVKRGIEDIIYGIDRAVILLISVLMIPFLAFYALMFVPNTPSLWVVYAAINPMFGNLFAETMTKDWQSFLWIVSTVIPSLSILFGMSLRIKHYERKQL